MPDPNELPAINLGVIINQAHGQAVESRQAVRGTVDLLRSQLQQTAGKSQSAIARASRDAIGRLSKLAGKAQGAIDGALMDMSGQLQQAVENAIVPLIGLDVVLPSDRLIGELKAQHAKELQESRAQLASAHPGVSGPGIVIEPPPPPPPPPPLPGDTGQINCTCDVHKFPDEFTRRQYRFLARKLDGTYVVCNASSTTNVVDLQQLTFVASAPQWWQNELICHLMNDCAWKWEWIQTYWQAIIRVGLYQNQSGVNMGALCDNAAHALNVLLAQITQ